jgi:hypothetical protein
MCPIYIFAACLHTCCITVTILSSLSIRLTLHYCCDVSKSVLEGCELSNVLVYVTAVPTHCIVTAVPTHCIATAVPTHCMCQLFLRTVCDSCSYEL